MFTRTSFTSIGPDARTTEPTISLGTYPTYVEAQAVVDTLADRAFEVETTQIIGSNLQMIEQVTGRQTWSRAIAEGVVQGVWFGVFIGLILGIVSTASFMASIAWGVAWGAVFWGVFAGIDYARTGGRRDFTSQARTVPTTFEVLVEADHAELARSTLASVV